jgi:hypothetical protein
VIDFGSSARTLFFQLPTVIKNGNSLLTVLVMSILSIKLGNGAGAQTRTLRIQIDFGSENVN